MPSQPLPERPITVSPRLACQLGLEGATLVAILADYAFHQPARIRNGYRWYRLTQEQAGHLMPFWNGQDIQRITQTLRSQGLLLLASAPFAASGELKFAFNQKVDENQSPAPVKQDVPMVAASPIAAHWSPGSEITARLAEHNIPDAFIRELVPEFVTYWRERGDSQRSWGAKFQSFCVRRWRQYEDRRAREQKMQAAQTPLPEQWQPDDHVLKQLSQEGIPMAYINDCASRFRLYYRETGAVMSSWAMTFYAWVKRDWEEKQTPFLPNRKPVAMSNDWRPAEHSVEYLKKMEVDDQFIEDCVPEFIHKWIEQGSYRNNWGDLFCQHVGTQWNFLRQGITPTKVATLITDQWQPSPECVELLQNQCEMPGEFIQSQLPEFVLYWRNRSEPRHSWDSIYIRHLKYIWARQNQLGSNANGNALTPHERQQASDRPSSTRDASLAARLTDRSWAY
ncbi:DnaT-like ssDNA-binding domain-containing protein [Halioxenophilus aromaticivorans]|uniref:DnaT DNA-binding domain-containing protein n=1 Tax=Halioxenophilus aromaticivorans TaxID=1306992 RepID=A0AAV3U1W5_9ALTE